MRHPLMAVIPLAIVAGLVGPVSTRGETIAVFTKSQTNPLAQAVRVGSDAAAKSLGAKVVHYLPNKPDSIPEQLSQVDDAVAAKPDAVVFIPVDVKALVPAIEKLNAAGIPVVNIVDRIASDKLVAFVGADDYNIGRETARHLLKAIGGNGNVVILEGQEGTLTSAARLQGFNDALKEFPAVKLLTSQSANYQRRLAVEVMEKLLGAFPQIDGVIAANDPMAIGAADALAKNQRKALVVGINGSKEAIDLIKSGKLLASGEFDGFTLGCLGTKIAVRNLRKQSVPAEVLLKTVVIDKANYERHETRLDQRQCPTLDEATKR
jgi:ribose transport system substrate-binding protein